MRIALSVGFFLGATASSALPQTIGSNQVYIGQTGDTNTVTIDQQGNDNLVGEDADLFRLNQLGDLNEITVEQFGYDNDLGSQLREGSYKINGPNQEGDRNLLTVNQSNLNPLSGNRIEATGQSALSGRASIGNIMTIGQQADADDIGHTIGQAVQVNDQAAGVNRMEIVQNGTDGDGGNRMEQLWQSGSENFAGLLQQAGGNTFLTLSQQGFGNVTLVEQIGSDNFIDAIIQNNAVTGSRGNSAEIRLMSSANGTSSEGGVSDFAAGFAAVFKPGQASVMQLGSANTLYYEAADGPSNLFGFTQDGDGNDINGLSIGTANEIAIAQFGDGNDANILQTGEDNSAGLLQDGSYNRLDVIQDGADNRAAAFITGSSNNRSSSFASPSLAAAASSIAGGMLRPGDIRQSGNGNGAAIDVFGDDNAFAIYQSGSANATTGMISGSGNQAVIIQSGDDNIAGFAQYGSGNSVLIEQ